MVSVVRVSPCWGCWKHLRGLVRGESYRVNILIRQFNLQHRNWRLHFHRRRWEDKYLRIPDRWQKLGRGTERDSGISLRTCQKDKRSVLGRSSVRVSYCVSHVDFDMDCRRWFRRAVGYVNEVGTTLIEHWDQKNDADLGDNPICGEIYNHSWVSAITISPLHQMTIFKRKKPTASSTKWPNINYVLF